MKLSQIRSIILTLVLCSNLSECVRRKADVRSDTLRMSLGSDPIVLDPSLADTGASVTVLKQVLNTLLTIDSHGMIVPQDAEKFVWKDKGSNLQVILRSDLKWSDGKELTACQFRDAWLHVLNPTTPASLADLFYDVRGAENFKKGVVGESSVGIACLDEKREIVLSVKTPFSSKILYALTFIISAPFRKDRFQQLKEKWVVGDKIVGPVSTGAYVVKEWQRDRRVKLQSRWSLGENNLAIDNRANIAWIDLPIVKDPTTAMSMYESNTLDVLEEIPTAFLTKIGGRKDHVLSSYLTTYFVAFSMKANPVLKNVKVRQALAYSAGQPDVPLLLKGGEQEAKSWVHPELVPETERVTTSLNMPERAKALLEEAGFRDRKKFPKLHLQYNSGDKHQLLMERLAYHWKNQLGIEVELVPVEWKVHVAQVKSQAPDLFRYAWTAVYPDALFFLELFRSDSLNNFGQWKNKDYDSLLNQLVAVSIDKRDSNYYKNLSKAENILTVQDPALIPLYHYVRNTLIKPHLKNFSWDFRGMSPLKKATLERL